MTQQLKAKSLYDQYLVLVRGGNLNETYHHKAKDAATICVDEILADYQVFNEKHKSFKVPSFWQSAKEEIQQL